ncbi:hypothetical protein B0H34DRAFT_130295 [Crassisporium funariophilum]|nr:hypothetical protein B0H34DRAFT_130295 [Crassisporium funariophilum]
MTLRADTLDYALPLDRMRRMDNGQRSSLWPTSTGYRIQDTGLLCTFLTYSGRRDDASTTPTYFELDASYSPMNLTTAERREQGKHDGKNVAALSSKLSPPPPRAHEANPASCEPAITHMIHACKGQARLGQLRYSCRHILLFRGVNLFFQAQ